MAVVLDSTTIGASKDSYSDLLAIADRAAWSLYRSNPSARLYGIDDLKGEAHLALVTLGLDVLASMLPARA